MPPAQEMVRRFANEIRQKLESPPSQFLIRGCHVSVSGIPTFWSRRRSRWKQPGLGLTARKTFSSGSRNMRLYYRNYFKQSLEL